MKILRFSFSYFSNYIYLDFNYLALLMNRWESNNNNLDTIVRNEKLHLFFQRLIMLTRSQKYIWDRCEVILKLIIVDRWKKILAGNTWCASCRNNFVFYLRSLLCTRVLSKNFHCDSIIQLTYSLKIMMTYSSKTIRHISSFDDSKISQIF